MVVIFADMAGSNTCFAATGFSPLVLERIGADATGLPFNSIFAILLENDQEDCLVWYSVCRLFRVSVY